MAVLMVRSSRRSSISRVRVRVIRAIGSMAVARIIRIPAVATISRNVKPLQELRAERDSFPVLKLVRMASLVPAEIRGQHDVEVGHAALLLAQGDLVHGQEVPGLLEGGQERAELPVAPRHGHRDLETVQARDSL